MSNEVKRGAPTEDGVWDVVLKDGTEGLCRRRPNGTFPECPVHTMNGVCVNPTEILAHRKHEPLVVPPLKELAPLPRQHNAVVLLQDGNGERFGLPGPFTATIIGDTAYYEFRHWSGSPYSTCKAKGGCFRELTKAECEAAGYRWPF